MLIVRLGILVTLLPCLSAAEAHWAYQPPQEAITAAGSHPVDALLDAARATAGLQAAPLAPPRQWLERAAFTLTGLPPSPAQIQRLEATPDDATWLSLIDEFLASPAYGERWARHWMDVARYADTQGYNFDQDNRYPFAYTYRDWLIRAFNDDLPYDRFVQLQIAADLLVKQPNHPDLAALGFLTVGPRAGGPELIDDRIDVITRGFLSSTVACARCHEHKSDPITMKDYYSLHSILENTVEPEEKPVIGTPPDAPAHQAFLTESAKLDEADRAARQEIVGQLRAPASLAVYLELAWAAHTGNWDAPKATSESFKRGRYRPQAVLRWRDFLRLVISGDAAEPRLAAWAAAMQAAADDAGARRAPCESLARDWLAAAPDSPLAALAKRGACPLAYEVDRIPEIMDVLDGNAARSRRSAMSRLQAEHPGSPPRAMCLADRTTFQPARTYKRGKPGAPEEPFERQWLSFLGGGPFPAGKSPRLSLAEKITDPANPLTSRVIVNRVWAWHFGAALADPGDFGPQESPPALLSLLDTLAVRFDRSGHSLKQLHRLLLTSRAFRLAADGPPANEAIDQANTRFWKWNRRRADFEVMRDRILATAGTLDTTTTGGRSVPLDSEAADPRRSLYAFIDRYAMPTTLVSFDLPHPDHHSPKRLETIVPQQALWILNGPLILRQAAKLAAHPDLKALPDDPARIAWLYQRIYQRAPTQAESATTLSWLSHLNPADYLPRLSGVWEIRHAPDTGGPLPNVSPFPLFADGVWKTGPDPATAPIRWLHAGPTAGHAAAGQALILRWRALGAGEARMTGSIRRTQPGGADLVWNLASPRGESHSSSPLTPAGNAAIDGAWIAIKPGDTLDFILRAPHGDSFGGVAWDLRVEGRETPNGSVTEIGNLQTQFPTADAPTSLPPPADPWADLIHMLWAANEFHFID